MNSEGRIPKKQILAAEFQLMLSKETEMKDLYNGILERVENQHVRKNIESIRDDKIKHVGYVKIIMSLMDIEQNDVPH